MAVNKRDGDPVLQELTFREESFYKVLLMQDRANFPELGAGGPSPSWREKKRGLGRRVLK